LYGGLTAKVVGNQMGKIPRAGVGNIRKNISHSILFCG